MDVESFDFEAYKAKVPPGWKFLGINKEGQVFLESDKHNVVVHAAPQEALVIANGISGSHREKA